MNYVEKVREFMTVFNQPIVDKPIVMDDSRNKLRIALIFEELKEYAKASGLSDYFAKLADEAHSEFIDDPDLAYVPIVDITEQFDALLDLQYVLSGAVLENGFGDIFDEGFEEVHRSNMSKACSSIQEAEETCDKYAPISCTYDTRYLPIIVYRHEDNKVLKSINYSPANLEGIINKTIR